MVGDGMRAAGAVRSRLGSVARVRCCATLSLWGLSMMAWSLPTPDARDPLNSPSWGGMRERFFPGQALTFDDRVQVIAPSSAEDALNVPVKVDASGLEDVQEIVVIADLNPIPHILSFRPLRAVPALSFRFKVEQSTPIRAAARTQDGVWHVGGVWLSAAGGGCTTPSGGSRGLWHGQVGEMSAREWPGVQGGARLRLRFIHPMDTGLASGIPAFYMDHLRVLDRAGTELASLDTYEPVSENPIITLDVRGRGPVRVEAQDTQGDRFGGVVAP